jgi:hypothetical protein
MTAEETVSRANIGTPAIVCYFGFDSPARVCFLSVPNAADLMFLHGLRECDRGNFKSESSTGIMMLPVPLLFPKFVSGVPR